MLKFERARGPVAPAVLRYGLAVFSVATSLSATLLLQGYTFPTLLFFPSIMLITWFGDTGPGLLAVLRSTLSINFVLNPQGTLATRFHDIPNLAAFVLSALLVCTCRSVLRTCWR
jgi:Domain of unknown function (DUF4118)